MVSWFCQTSPIHLHPNRLMGEPIPAGIGKERGITFKCFKPPGMTGVSVGQSNTPHPPTPPPLPRSGCSCRSFGFSLLFGCVVVGLLGPFLFDYSSTSVFSPTAAFLCSFWEKRKIKERSCWWLLIFSFYNKLAGPLRLQYCKGSAGGNMASPSGPRLPAWSSSPCGSGGPDVQIGPNSFIIGCTALWLWVHKSATDHLLYVNRWRISEIILPAEFKKEHFQFSPRKPIIT